MTVLLVEREKGPFFRFIFELFGNKSHEKRQRNERKKSESEK